MTAERDREAQYRAKLQTLIGAEASAMEFVRLRDEAARVLGDENPTVLQLACRAEIALSGHRDIARSLLAWKELLDRAEMALPEEHGTLITIRSFYIRHLRFRAAYGDLDEVVRLRTTYSLLWQEHKVSPQWISIACADLAVAYIDRGRFGHLDPRVRCPDHVADLTRAKELAEAEVKYRISTFGTDHPFTWHAHGILTEAAVVLARRAGSDEGGSAQTMAKKLLGYHSDHQGRDRQPVFRASLLHAESLNADRQYVLAARRANLICMRMMTTKTRMGSLDPGRPLLVLAEAQAQLAPNEALRNAEAALGIRQRIYGQQSYKVAEAQLLITRLASR
jgi:hypothetical protein